METVDAHDVFYRVSFADASAHYVNVTLKTQASTDSLELMMPVWTPGSYLVRE